MKILLVAYAMYSEVFPENPFSYEVQEGITASKLMDRLAEDFQEVAGLLPYTRLAHEQDYLDREAVLKANEEYCLIPPVSGGS